MQPEQPDTNTPIMDVSEPVVEPLRQPVTAFTTPTIDKPHRLSRRVRLFLMFIGFKVFAVVAFYLYILHLNTAPDDFRPQTITIEPGQSAAEIATKLATAGVVRSAELLQGALLYFQDPTQIKATTYTFTEPQTTTEIAETLVTGEFDNDLRSLTFVEGMRAQDYAVVAATIPGIDPAEFITLTQELEGSLFPETYFVPETITATELVELLTNTHKERIAPYQTQFAANNLTSEEALILASIIEREANTPESMRTVAGIFLNRLAIGMALQADASIEYVIEKPLGELAPGQLASELRELDSPYNTYLYPGLPPTPIGNPGETAIAAIADPIQSDYYYYITGDDGEFYYAETFDEHRVNIARHLR